MQRQSIMLLCLLCFILSTHLITLAQNDCLPPRVFPGQTITITGSIDAGGMPYRAENQLASHVEGFVPIGEIISTTEYMAACVDGRNWYQVNVLTDVGNRLMWILDGDGVNYWIEPTELCQFPNRGGLFTVMDHWGTIAEMNYLPGTNRVILAFNELGQNDHPSQLDHYAFDLMTGEIAESMYPFTNVIDRDLTDQLGISDWVFNGNNGAEGYSIYLSPDQQKILYFILGEAISPCAHNCHPLTGFIANADGTNPVEIGQFFTEAGLVRVHWGVNDRLYLSHITVTAGYFSGEICIDGTCARSISNMLETEYNLSQEEIVPYYPTVSSDGRYMALTSMIGGYGQGRVIDLQTGRMLNLPASGSIAFPALWDNDNSLWLPIMPDGDPDFTHDKPYILNLNLNIDEETVGRSTASAEHNGLHPLPFIGINDWIRTEGSIVINYGGYLEVFCIGLG